MTSEVKPTKHKLGVSERLLNVSYVGGVVGSAGLALKPFDLTSSAPFSPFWVSLEGLLIQQVESSAAVQVLTLESDRSDSHLNSQ